MAIEQTSITTDLTLFAGQHLDRLSPTPTVVGLFVRVEATGQTNAFGLPVYRRAPNCWRYSIRITDPALLANRQAFALRMLVKEAMIENQSPKTDAEVAALVNALMARGISLDHVQTQAWEDLETRRRAGQVFPVAVEVAEGKPLMEAAGLPTK